MEFLTELKTSDWVIAGATLLGPVLAVQAQKVLERFRAYNERKREIFGVLMATRLARLSTRHVDALNTIDLAYAGRPILGLIFRWPSEKRVMLKWREYLDCLNIRNPPDEGQLQFVSHTRNEAFLSLLVAMSDDLRYGFDRLTIKNMNYAPIAHENLEVHQAAVRERVLEVLDGKRPVNIVSHLADSSVAKLAKLYQPAQPQPAPPNVRADDDVAG